MAKRFASFVLGLAILIGVAGGVQAQGYNSAGFGGSSGGRASSLGPAALGAYSGSVGVAGNQGNGGDYLSNVNLNGEQNVASYAANPRSSAVTSVTATTAANSIVVNLSAADGFIKHEGIAIYGAGPACSINSTACSGITVPAPTITQTGYTGANGGSTVTYQYEIAATDANYGLTAASAASSVNGPAVLSEPSTTNLSTTHDTGGNYNTLSGYGVTGASHYCIWRNTAGVGYRLWAVTDSTTFKDWSNHQSQGTNGPCGGNTPPSASVADVLTTSIVSVGSGGTSLGVASAPSQSGAFTAWPDATAAFQGAYNAFAAGGSIYAPAGFYHVQNIQPPSIGGFYLRGAGGAESATQLATVIVGTDGEDMFSWPSAATSSYGFRDMVLRGGRNTFNVPAGGSYLTYVHLDNLKINAPDYAAIEAGTSIEEWYAKNVYFNLGWYGIDQNGDAYIQKSHFIDSTFNGQVVNAVHIDTNTVLFEGNTFDRTIVQSIDQDGVWITGASATDKFDGYIDEQIGADFNRNVSTATCTSASDVVAVTSVTGLAIGQDYTVHGCGANNFPLTGTICAISGNNVTLEIPTCTTAQNAGTTQSTARYSTNAIFDNFLLVADGGTSDIELTNGILAQTGGNGNGTQTRYQVYDAPGSMVLINIASTYIASPVSTTVVYNSPSAELIRPVPFAVFLSGGLLSTPQQSGPGGGNYASVNSPWGGDIDLGLVDSTANGSGTGGCFKILQNDSSRNYIWETCSNISSANSATSLFRGSIENSNGDPLINNGTASIAGGGVLATGSGAFAGTVTGAAATGNVVTPGMTCPNDVVAILGDETTAGGAKVTAKSTTTFTFSATASDVVDYIASCR